MNYLSRKSTKALRFYLAFKCIVLFMVLQGMPVFGNPKIYLIRHAAVDLKNPGWGTSKNSSEYKNAYNLAKIEPFNPDEVLQKIENHENSDTVFCSPQSRAVETAIALFGGNAVLKTDNALAELDYPVVQVPLLQFPVKGWLLISRVTWMAGLNRKEKPGYRERLDRLNAFTDDLEKFAHRNELAVVVAHGMLNRELVKILKDRGWDYCYQGKKGFGNLSVICLEYCN